MINSIFIIMNIKVSRKINGFLYFLKKIPLVKMLFKNKDYSMLTLKKFLSVISLVYTAIAGPIKFALLFILTVFLPSKAFSNKDPLTITMFLIFVFYFLSKSLGSLIMEPSEEKFLIVKQMKMPPKIYGLSEIILDGLVGIFSKSLVLSLIFKYGLGKTFFPGIVIGINIAMARVFMEAFHLYFYKKTGFIINKLKKTQFIVAVIGIVVSYLLVAFTNLPQNLNLFSLITSTVFTGIFILLGVLGFRYLLNYDRYWDIINEDNKLESFKDMNESLKDINFLEVKLEDKDFNENSLRENDNIEKEGYDFLNYIFFKRHKKIVFKPMIIKSITILAVFLLIFILDKFFLKGIAVDAANGLIDNYTIFIFLIYLICNSTTIIKSLFYNCDRSLLRYGFYKEGDALLKMFFLRFRKIVAVNMLPLAVLSIGILELMYLSARERIGESIPMILVILILGILFSVHYIFLYYILQPFATGLEIKSPLYGIINFGVYFISYIFIDIKLSASQILPYLLGFSAIYITASIILVYKKAPKTFRVK